MRRSGWWLGLLLAISVNGCQTKPKPKVSTVPEDELPPRQTQTKAELPPCDGSLDGQIYYVIDDKAYYLCTAGTWKEAKIEPRPTPGSSPKPGDKPIAKDGDADEADDPNGVKEQEDPLGKRAQRKAATAQPMAIPTPETAGTVGIPGAKPIAGTDGLDDDVLYVYNGIGQRIGLLLATALSRYVVRMSDSAIIVITIAGTVGGYYCGTLICGRIMPVEYDWQGGASPCHFITSDCTGTCYAAGGRPDSGDILPISRLRWARALGGEVAEEVEIRSVWRYDKNICAARENGQAFEVGLFYPFNGGSQPLPNGLKYPFTTPISVR